MNLNLGKSKISAGIVALVTAFMILAMAGSAAAAADGSMSDVDTGVQYIGPGQQKMVQEVTITDSGAGDTNDLKVDRFLIQDQSTADDGDISSVTLWKESTGDGSWSTSDTQLGSSVSSFEGGDDYIGGNDDSPVLTVANGTSENVYVVVTLAAGATDDHEIKTKLDGTDLVSTGSSSWSGDGYETATTGTIIDSVAPTFSNNSPTGTTNDNQATMTVDISEDTLAVDEGSIVVTVENSTGYKHLDAVGTGDAHVSWDGSTLTIDPSAGTPFTFNDDTITVSVDAADTVGNTGSTTWSFTVDTSPPVVSSSSAVEVTGDQTADVDGKLDKITITMDETLKRNRPSPAAFTVTTEDGKNLPVDSVAAGGADTEDSDLGASSGTTVVIDLKDDDKVVGTGAPTVTYTAADASVKIKDQYGNPFESQTVTVTDDANPIITSGSYIDSNNDGTIDNVKLNFSENLATYTFSADAWDWFAGDFTSFTFDAKSSQSGNTIILNVTPGDGDETDSDADVQVEYRGDGTYDVTDDSSANNEVYVADGADTTGINPSAEDHVTLDDAAAPVNLSSGTNTGSGNPLSNTINLAFTEDLDVTYTTLNVSGYSYVNATLGTTTVITLKSEMGTGETPTVTYTAGDPAGNQLSGSATPTDSVGPVIVDAVLNDLNNDNYATESDNLTVTFSEPMNESTVDATNAGNVLNGDGNLPSAQIESVSWGADNTTLSIALSTSEDIATGEKLSYSSDQAKDVAGNYQQARSSSVSLEESTSPVTIDTVRYRSIGSAVSAAESYSSGSEPADTITVGAGTYGTGSESFSITVDKAGLTIQAASGATPVVDASGSSAYAFDVTASDVTLDGLKIVGDTDEHVVFSRPSSDIGVLTIKNCELVIDSPGGSNHNALHLYPTGTAHLQFANNLVRGLGTKNSVGLYAWELNASVTDNVRNNVFKNLEVGSKTTTSGDVVYDNNLFENIRDESLIIDSDHPVIWDETYVIENSDFTDTGRGIYIMSDTDDLDSITVANNNFENADAGYGSFTGYALATEDGVNSYDASGTISVTVTAENNYWGDDSGPYVEGDATTGAGGMIEDATDKTYDPWLTSKDGQSYDFMYVLESGQNLVSLPRIPDDNSISVVTGPTADLVKVWGYGGQSWASYDPTAPSNALTTMVDGQGYWVETDATSVLAFNGSKHVAAGSDPRTYDVYNGWNLIGFKNTTAKTAYKYLGGTVSGITEQLYEAPHGTYSTVDYTSGGGNMNPGFGYWLATSDSGTIYP